MMNFVSSKISKSQFGFQKHHLSLHQLLEFTSLFIGSVEKRAQCEVLYLDFKKVFDSIPHDELLYKLHEFGITGDLWYWFKEYLSSCIQCVSVNNETSDLLPVLSWVPQGSILGPLLFSKWCKQISKTENAHQLQQDLNSVPPGFSCSRWNSVLYPFV